MLMTTTRLITLRLYAVTLGRFPVFSRLLKETLVRILVKGKKDKYVASSLFFSWEDLEYLE